MADVSYTGEAQVMLFFCFIFVFSKNTLARHRWGLIRAIFWIYYVISAFYLSSSSFVIPTRYCYCWLCLFLSHLSPFTNPPVPPSYISSHLSHFIYPPVPSWAGWWIWSEVEVFSKPTRKKSFTYKILTPYSIVGWVLKSTSYFRSFHSLLQFCLKVQNSPHLFCLQTLVIHSK